MSNDPLWSRYWNGTLLVPDFGRDPAGVELYAHTGDMEADFDMFENENVAATNKDTVDKLHAIAVKQWAHGDCHESKKPCINNYGLSCC